MPQLLDLTSGASCKGCGAIYAQCGRHPVLCDWCFRRVVYSSKTGTPSNLDIAKWLAAEVIRGVKRLKVRGINSRCEAITGFTGAGQHGHQCSTWADGWKHGRPVCWSHGSKAHVIQFVDNRIDPYLHIERLMTEVAVSDSDFRVALENALKATAA
jgi:hypothetical protein